MPVHPALPWILRSIARLERAGGVRGPRLTEPGFERWHRVRRKLGWTDFIVVLCEDLSEAFPEPFAFDRWVRHPLDSLTNPEAQALVEEAARPDGLDTHAFLREAARALGLPTGGAFTALLRVQPGERVLELPGSGGRIAAWQVLDQPTLDFSGQYVFVADSDAERVPVGLAAVELRANVPTIWPSARTRDAMRTGPPFHRVVGIRGHAPAERLAADLGPEVRWA